MGKPVDECEVREGSGWVTIGIAEALERRGEDMRCPECAGPVRPHKAYSDGMRAHFEHKAAHLGCSINVPHSGMQTQHPDALS